MAPRWPFTGLLLLSLLYRGGGEVITVTQTPTLQVALARETVSVTCRVLAPQTYFAIAVGIYKVDVAGQETLIIDIPYHNDSHPAPENANLTLSMSSFRFQPGKDPHSTGSNYYCIATAPMWTITRFRGEGTFIHVRDNGYVRNRRRGLHVFLTTTCGVLTALSLVGTGLLLLWKKKGYPTCSSVKAQQTDGRQEEAVSGCSTADPTYTSLEPNSADTYDIIEREVEMQPSASMQSGPVPSMPKHKQLEKKKSPDIQAGAKKTTPNMSLHPAAKQEKVFDTVYENL